MLVATRQISERIMVGDDIVITIMDIQAGAVRVGISAPKNIPVFREEIYKRLFKERPCHVERRASAM